MRLYAATDMIIIIIINDKIGPRGGENISMSTGSE